MRICKDKSDINWNIDYPLIIIFLLLYFLINVQAKKSLFGQYWFFNKFLILRKISKKNWERVFLNETLNYFFFFYFRLFWIFSTFLLRTPLSQNIAVLDADLNLSIFEKDDIFWVKPQNWFNNISNCGKKVVSIQFLFLWAYWKHFFLFFGFRNLVLGEKVREKKKWITRGLQLKKLKRTRRSPVFSWVCSTGLPPTSRGRSRGQWHHLSRKIHISISTRTSSSSK